MNGNEEVRVVLVGDIRTSAQRNECVGRSRHHHFHVIVIGFYLARETLCYIKCNTAFIGLLVLADASGVCTAVSCINADSLEP